VKRASFKKSLITCNEEEKDDRLSLSQDPDDDALTTLNLHPPPLSLSLKG
jgi:hypothetical protein